MIDAGTGLLNRAWNSLRFRVLHGCPALRSWVEYKAGYGNYLAQLQFSGDARLENSAVLKTGDASVRSREYFDYYDAFANYAFRTIWNSHFKTEPAGRTCRIFDLGSTKTFIGMLSVICAVDSLNLNDPLDRLTSANYICSDVSDYDPRQNEFRGQYDFVTSLVSFHLLGLGRYGDRLNAGAQTKFIEICDELLRIGGRLVFSFSVGKDQLRFNDGWVFSLETMKGYFPNYDWLDVTIDTNGFGNIDPRRDAGQRFVKIDPAGDFSEYRYRDFVNDPIPYDVAFVTLQKRTGNDCS